MPQASIHEACRRGDIDAGPDQPHGLFYKDTRFLSRWLLTVSGEQPTELSTDDVDYFSAQFFLVPKTGTIYKNPYLSRRARRLLFSAVSEGLSLGHGCSGRVVPATAACSTPS